MSHLFVFLILCVFSCVLQASTTNTFDVTIAFSENDLIFKSIDGYDLVHIDLPRADLSGEPGEPLLPVYSANILLPDGAQVVDIQTTVEDEVQIEGVFNIFPAQTPIPTDGSVKGEFTHPKAEVYRSSKRQRGDAAIRRMSGKMRGRSLTSVQLYPVDYIPADGTLTLRKQIRITVQYETETQSTNNRRQPTSRQRKYRQHPAMDQMIRQSVLNPEAINTTDTDAAETESSDIAVSSTSTSTDVSTADAGETVEYLIITDSSLADAFSDLADWKTKKGIPAEIVTLDWIYANYSADTNQQQIKLCIRDYVENYGTVWVVLGADSNLLPDHDCYVKVSEETYDETMPTDLYYADIDDLDWDDDGDGKAGEITSEGDTVDLYPDCYVGRISVRTVNQVNQYTEKVLSYEKSSPSADFAKHFLGVGVHLFSDDYENDAEAKSQTMWGSYIDPYWNGTYYMLFDTATSFTGGADYAVNSTHVNEQIANGYNFFHMATHGNTTIWSMEEGGAYSTSNAFAANSPNGYTNIATIACITNAFDKTDACLGEAFIRDSQGGAVSYVGCSRYGWGWATESSLGPSFQYNAKMYQYLFGETYTHNLGVVLAKAKENKIGSSSGNGAMRWVQFGLNLLGDPELPLYTDDPQTLSPIFPVAVSVGTQIFEVNTGVSGAKVCLMKDGEIYTYGTADSSGLFEASITPITTGDMDVTITAQNYYPYEGTVTISSGPAGLAAFSKDQCVPNETVGLYLIDTDLQGLGSYGLTVTTNSGDSETITLTEDGSTGMFYATLTADWQSDFAAVAGDGIVSVGLHDQINVTYQDADDGTGQPAISTDSIAVDYIAPQNQIALQSPLDDSVICNLSSSLVWTDTAEEVIGYDIYFGTDQAAVEDATTESAEYQGTQTTMSYAPEQLARDMTYYWRIDAVMLDSSVQTGAVHHFFTSVTSEALSDGLLVYWPFEDAAGTAATDASGNGNDGTLMNSPTWTAGGVLGGAIDFDGTDDYVNLQPFSGPLTEYTVSMWAKADTVEQNQYVSVFSNASSSTGNSFQIDFDSSSNYRYKGDSAVTLGAVTTDWVHIVVACDGSTSDLYVNNVLVGTTSDDGVFNALRVACNRNNSTRFDGKIDEVRLYNRMLSTAEIWALYNQVAEASIQAHWKLDETVGETAVDTSDNAFDADCLGGLSFDSDAAAGIRDGAIELNGTTDYLEAPDGFDDFSYGITLSVWAYTTDYQKWSRFFDFANGSANDNIVLGTLSTSSDLFFDIYNESSSGGKLIAADAIKLNEWQMFTATCDAKGNACIYVNGQLVQEGTTAVPNNVTRINNYIGRSNWTNDEYYQGCLDEIRVYPYALRSESIENLYWTTFNTPPEGLTATTASGAVNLDWEDSSAAVSYRVYRSTESGGPYSQIAETTVSDFIDTTAANSFTWYYVITSVSSALMESDYSEEVTASPNYPGDLTIDGHVDMDDIVALSKDWQEYYDTSTLILIAEDWLCDYLDDSTVTHWKLDETAGMIALDSSGHGYHGTLMNMDGSEWTTDSTGNALVFDGVDDYIEIQDYKGVTGSAGRTCTAWIKTSKADCQILSWGVSEPGKKWIIRVNTTGELRAEIQGAQIYGTTVLTDDQWHHVAVVLENDGSPDMSEVQLYVDGTLEAIQWATALPVNTSASRNVQIGVYTFGPKYYKGQMSDVRIYNRALSADEIAELAR